MTDLFRWAALDVRAAFPRRPPRLGWIALLALAACPGCGALNPPRAFAVTPDPVVVSRGASQTATLRYAHGAEERRVSFLSANGVLVSAATATLRPGETVTVTVRVDDSVARGEYGVTVYGKTDADAKGPKEAYFTVQVR